MGREEGNIVNDEKYIKAVLDGDVDAFRDLIERYRALLFAAVWKIVRSRQDAEDIVQDTFIQIYQSLYQFQNQQGVGFKTWIMRIATHKAIDWMRRNKSRPDHYLVQENEMSDSDVECSATLEAEVIKQEEKKELHSLLRRLPNDYRKVVELYYFQDKSYKEIAEVEKIAVKTVESRLYRAKKMMRQSGKGERT